MALALVVPAFLVEGTTPVLACSGPGVPLPAVRFSSAASDEGYQLVLLGEVLDEARIQTGSPSGREVFLSNVRTVVPMAGDALLTTVRVGPHGFGDPDCSGGPRLLPGEKVMLFLYPSRGVFSSQGDQTRFGDWQSGQFGTPILFEGDSAYYLSWARFSNQTFIDGKDFRTYVGRAEEVLRLALARYEVSPAGREAAFNFILGTTDGAHILPPRTGDGGLAEVQ